MRGAAGFCQVGDAPVFIQLPLRRLNVTRFIRGTRHDYGLLSIPLPVKIESGMRLRVHGPVNPRFPPALAAVGRYLNLGDLARAGPSEARDLDIAFAQFHSG